MSSDTVSMEEQADIIEEFLEGLTEAFGVQPEINRETIDDEMLELQVEAPDLGLLIGPKGQTLAAVQELARTVLQRKATGTYEGRVRIDIAGYRSRRREALEKFATGVADQVRESGTQKVLEPMSPPDRKVVHDTVNDLDGVVTASEGTEPYRRVVIKPA
jgi:spoIIIJ-associated protein